MSNLDRDLAEMRRLGYTSYGKYKLDYSYEVIPPAGNPGGLIAPASCRYGRKTELSLLEPDTPSGSRGRK